MVDADDLFRRELFPLVLIEPFVAISYSIDMRDSVVVVQAVDNFSDDYVQSWTEASSGDDTCSDFARLEIDEFTRTSSQVFLGLCDGVLWAENRPSLEG